MAKKKKRQQKFSQGATTLPKQKPPSHTEKKEQLVKLELGQILKNFRLKSNKSLIQNITNKRDGTPLVSLILREGVKLVPNVVLPVFDVLRSVGKHDNIDLFLSSTGGATEVPWRIVSLVREFCKSYTAIIPFAALSAGTHIALGADSLIMSEISTLGPVDPSMQHPLQPLDKAGKPVPVSVEDLKNCIKFISQQLKDQDKNEKYSPRDMAEIVGKLFEHIEPLVIGSVERAYALSRLITKKVLETHLDPSKDKEKIEQIVDKIGGEYFSHAFPITRRDVEQELHLNVIKPEPELFDAIWQLHQYYSGAFSQTSDLNIMMEGVSADGSKQAQKIQFVSGVLGFIDSIYERRVLVQLRRPQQDPESGQIKEMPIYTSWIKPHSEELAETDSNFFLPAPKK
jgi:Serine dehydrogenase proteinase